MKSFKQYLAEAAGVKLGDGSIAQVGDAVSFKSDYEQTGTLVSVKKDMFNNVVLTLQSSNEDGFGGDYIDGEEYTQELAKHCWKEGGRFDEATRAPEQAADDEPNRRPSKTKEKDPWSDLDDIFAPKADQPLSKVEPEKDQDEPADTPDNDRRNKVSQADTLRAAGNITPTDSMRDMMSRMRDIEADDSEYPTPDEQDTLPSTRVNTANLPAVAGQALAAAGVQEPDFHQVANLPGNMSRAIRTLGKALFRSFTRTPTEDIYMIGNVGGQGPNTNQEINAVAGWLRDEGESITSGDIDFDTSIPGYQADIRQYRAEGIRWLVVMDEFGKYIYSWPERDSLDAGNDELPAPERNQARQLGR